MDSPARFEASQDAFGCRHVTRAWFAHVLAEQADAPGKFWHCFALQIEKGADECLISLVHDWVNVSDGQSQFVDEFISLRWEWCWDWFAVGHAPLLQ